MSDYTILVGATSILGASFVSKRFNAFRVAKFVATACVSCIKLYSAVCERVYEWYVAFMSQGVVFERDIGTRRKWNSKVYARRSQAVPLLISINWARFESHKINFEQVPGTSCGRYMYVCLLECARSRED